MRTILNFMIKKNFFSGFVKRLQYAKDVILLILFFILFILFYFDKRRNIKLCLQKHTLTWFSVDKKGKRFFIKSFFSFSALSFFFLLLLIIFFSPSSLFIRIKFDVFLVKIDHQK